jgi:hypothetical protein
MRTGRGFSACRATISRACCERRLKPGKTFHAGDGAGHNDRDAIAHERDLDPGSAAHKSSGRLA